MTEPTTTPPTKRRKRFGLSLRVLMLLVLLLGGGMGWYAYRARVQREAVAAIEAAGGKAYYDFEWAHSDFVDTPQFFADFTPIESRRPKWIVDLLGPDYLGSVVAVQFLNNSSNQADDELMRRIGRLSNLEVLQMAQLGITETVPGGCRVSDAGLAHLRGLSRLRLLDLSGTSVKGPGLVHLSGLQALRTLDLGMIPATVQDLSALISLPLLEQLTLESDRLTDAGLAHVTSLRHLKSLFIKADHISAAGLEQLSGLSHLQRLSIWGYGVENYRFLRQFPELTELFLTFTDKLSRQEDTGLTSLGTLSNLRELTLDGTFYPRSLLSIISGLKGLERLTIDSLKGIPSNDYSYLSGLNALESLRLIDSPVNDSVLPHFSGLKRLKILMLINSPITDAGLPHLSGLTELEWLHLGNTRITDAGLINLLPLKKCFNLDVDGTGVTPGGFAAYRAQQAAP